MLMKNPLGKIKEKPSEACTFPFYAPGLIQIN